MIYTVNLHVENTNGEVSAHNTSLTPPLLIEVPVKQDQKVYFYSCVLDIDFPSFYDFSIECCNCFLFFILLLSFIPSDKVCVVLPIYSKMEVFVMVIVSTDVYMYDDSKPTSCFALCP